MLTENFAIITDGRQELILPSSALRGQAVSGINFAKFRAPRLGASELQVEQFVIVASPSDGALQAVPVAKNYRRL